MKKQCRYFSLFVFVTVISIFSATIVFADGEEETGQKDIDIRLSPKDMLFNISNMKPGDWAPRTITVENMGNNDFDYYMQMENNGDEKLFNELMMEIKEDGKDLYTGKLSAFSSLPARKLTAGSEEKLDITIRFPESLGNDFQGLTAAFILKFTAEGKNSASSSMAMVMTKGQIDSGDSSSGGFNLPATSTNNYNYLFVGAILITGGIMLIIIRRFRRVKIPQ